MPFTPLLSFLSFYIKWDDLGTPQTPAEGEPPSALPLFMITLQVA